ncbi:MAG TPA: AMP-binding protein, partial [Stellaceae bacterium]
MDLVADTLPRLLRRNAAIMAHRPAIREKTLGIWRTFSWAEYERQVREFALGLAAHGFRRGDKLAVIGDNRPRLYWAQLAAQCLGGIAVPIYQDAIATEMAFVLNHAEIRVVVAEDQEQVDKILLLKGQLPTFALIVYDDPSGMRHYTALGLAAFEDVQAAGCQFAASHPGHFEGEIDKGETEDVALLTYTSGTTGNPKGVMLSHANLLAAARSFAAVEDIRPTDNILAYLPMAWIGESLFSLVLTLLVGFACNCPERPETVQRDLRELGPSVALAPPRIWENLLTQLRVRAADASPLKRRTFDYFRSLAEWVEAAR